MAMSDEQSINQAGQPPVADPAPGSKRRYAILGITSLGFLLSLFYRVSVAVISPQLSSDLGLSPVELGDLAAAFFYAFAASQIPLGFIMDRLGSRMVMTVLGLVGVAGAVLFGLAQNGTQALWGRILLGLGMGCNLMGTFTLLAAWFPVDRFALLSGVVSGLGTLGNLMAATPLAMAAQWLGWRGSFLAVAGINFLQVVILFLVVRDYPGGKRPAEVGKAGPSGKSRSLFTTYYFWAISLSTFVRYGFFVALQGLWVAPFLIYGLGFDPIEAGNALFLMGVGLMMGMPICGRLSDRWLGTRRGIVWPSLTGFALLVLCMSFWPKGISLWLVYVFFFCLGFVSGPGQIMYAHIKELVPPSMIARAMTGINLFTMLGAAAFTQILGMVISSDPTSMRGPEGFAPAWYLGAGALGLAAFLYFWTPEGGKLTAGSSEHTNS